jgi:hypothetical protein
MVRRIFDVLTHNDWNVTESARQLRLARPYVYNLITELALKRGDDGRPKPA